MALIDVDNFKQINDTYGHIAGDLALQTLVKTIKANVRPSDNVIRVGGDEFMIYFSKSGEKSIKPKLEDLIEKIRNAPIPGYPDLKMTVSIGCSDRIDENENIYQKVDRLLYAAKRTKNCIVYLDSEKSTDS